MDKHTNINLWESKTNINDEFYTTRMTIEDELPYYNFRGMRVFCNCDGNDSEFYKFFKDNFKKLELGELKTIKYNSNGKGESWVFDGHDEEHIILRGNGNFKSSESIEMLRNSDVVVTNPPFSLFAEFVEILYENNVKFLIIGNLNAVAYKTIFPKVMKGEIKTGVTLNGTFCEFVVPNDYDREFVREENGVKFAKINNCVWFTNMSPNIKIKGVVPKIKYEDKEFKRFDILPDIINIDKIKDIPFDYDGIMAVPITYMNKRNDELFKIVGLLNVNSYYDKNGWQTSNGKSYNSIDGKNVYKRILIRKIQ